MSIKDKVVNLIIRGRDLFSPEAKKSGQSMEDMRATSARLNAELKTLRDTSKELAKATELEAYGANLKTAVDEAQAALADLSEQLKATPGASQALKDAVRQTSSEVDALKTSITRTEGTVEDLSRTLRAGGVDLNKMGDEQSRLSAASAALTRELQTLKKAQADALKLGELRTNVGLAKAEFEGAEQRLKALAAQMDATKTPTRELKDAHRIAANEAGRASTNYQSLSRTLSQHEAAVAEAGLATEDLAKTELELSNAIGAAQLKLAELSKTQKSLSDYDKLTPQLVRQKAELEKNQAALAELRRELNQANAPQKALTEQVAKAAQMAGQAQIAYEKNEAKLAVMRQSLALAGVNARDFAGEQQRLARESAEATQQYQLNEKQLSLLQQQLNQAKNGASAFGSSINGMARNLLLAAGAYVGLDKLRQGLMSIITVGGQFEVMREQLIGVYGDVAQGEHAFKWAVELNKRLPTSLGDVLQAFVMLKNNGMDPMDGTLEKMINANVRYGKGAETLIPIIRQLTQSWGKNRIQAEEAYVLIENGLPVWQLLSEATGKSVASLQKMSEQGKLTREYMVQLIDTMGKAGAGVVERRMQTWEALVTKFSDSVDQMKDRIAQSGVLDFFKGMLSDLNREMAAMAEDGRLQVIAQRVSDWMRESAQSLRDWSRDAGASFQNMVAVVTMGVQTVRIAFNAFTGAIKFLAAAFLAPIQLVGQMMEKMAALAEAMGMKDAAENMRHGAGLINAQFRGMMDGFYEDMADIGDAGNKFADAAVKAGGKAGDGLANGIGDGVKKAKATLEEFEAAQAGGFKTMEDFYAAQSGGFNTLAEYLKKTGQSVEQYYAGVAAGSGELSAQLFNSFVKLAGDVDAETDKEISRQAAKREKAAMDTKKAVSDVFEELGLDYAQISGDTSKAVDGMIAKLQILKDAGVENGNALVAVFDKAFNLAKNKAEIDALTTEIDEFAASGKLAGQAHVEALGLAAEAAKKLADENKIGGQAYLDLLNKQKAASDAAYKAGTVSAEQHTRTVGILNQEIGKTTKELNKQQIASSDLNDAYTTLGITSAAALDKQAEAAKKAYAAIASTSGKIEDQKVAFLAYAEAQLKADKANQRFGDNSLLAQAQTLGLTEQLKALKTNIDTVGGSALITADALRDLGAASVEVQSQAEAATRYQSASNKAQLENIEKLQEGTRSATGTMVEFANKVVSANDLASLSLDQLRQKQAEYQSLVERSREYLHKSNDEWWADQVRQQLVANETNQRIAEQLYRVKELTEQLQAAEAPSLDLIANAERALSGMGSLDKATLSGLRSALDSAKQKMEALSDAAKDTLGNLQDELDQYNDNLAAVEERRYQNQLADLEAKLAEAKAANNADAVATYQQAIKLADQLHQKKLQDIAAEKAARAQEAANQQASAATRVTNRSQTAPTTSAPQSSQSPSQTQVIRIEMGSKTATVRAEPAEAANLRIMLGQIAQAKGVTSP